MSSTWVRVLIGVWCGGFLFSGAVFWFLLREEERAESPPEMIPRLPEPPPEPAPKQLEPPRTPTIQSVRRAAIDAEIAQLEKVIAAQEQLAEAWKKQRELLIGVIEEYGRLSAQADPEAARKLVSFRKKAEELATKRPEVEKVIEEAEGLRPVLEQKLATAEELLLARKRAVAPEADILDSTKSVGGTRQQLATLACLLAAKRDELAWLTVQHEALTKVLSGTKEEVAAAVSLLDKWQQPRQGIAAITSQLRLLRAERELLGK